MSLINTVRPTFVALAMAVSALALTACGSEDPDKLVKETFNGDHKAVNSGKGAVSISVTANGSPQLSQPVALKVSGPFQRQGKGKIPKFDFGASVSLSGQGFNAAAISTGSAGFLKVQGSAYELPSAALASLQQVYGQAQARAQAERNKSKDGSSAATLGIHPGSWLKDAKNEGDEDVGGADTTHVSANVDVPKLVADVNRAVVSARARGLPQAGQLPSAIPPAQQQQVIKAIRGAKFDFWTAKEDKLLRRLALKLTFAIPQAEQSRARGVRGGQLTVDYQLTDVNQPQTFVAPANPRPFSELRSAPGASLLGGLLGGGQAPPATGGATGAPPAPGGATGAPPATDAYQRCLAQAQGDVAKTQRCAALLGR